MGLPDYIPPTYEVWDIWNSRKKRQALQAGADTQMLRKEEFIRSCLASETSSVLTDLSSEERIRRFAKKAEDFDESLIGVMNRWAVYDDKEYIRDGISVDGRTASSLMWEYGLTFSDVVVGVQKVLDAPEQYDIKKVSISLSGPDKRQEENLLESSREMSGILQRVRNAFGEEKLSGKRSMNELFEDEFSKNAKSLREHNRSCLRAEQAVRLEGDKRKLFMKADRLLSEKEQWSLDMKERSKGLVSGTIFTVSTAGELLEEPVTAESSAEYGKDAECLGRLKEELTVDRSVIDGSAKEAQELLSDLRRIADAKEDERNLPELLQQLEGRNSLKVLRAAAGQYRSKEGLTQEAEREERLLSMLSKEQAERAQKEQEWKLVRQKSSPFRGLKAADRQAETSFESDKSVAKERVSLSSLYEEEPGKKTNVRRERLNAKELTKDGAEVPGKEGPTSKKR